MNKVYKKIKSEYNSLLSIPCFMLRRRRNVSLHWRRSSGIRRKVLHRRISKCIGQCVGYHIRSSIKHDLPKECTVIEKIKTVKVDIELL